LNVNIDFPYKLETGKMIFLDFDGTKLHIKIFNSRVFLILAY